MNEKKDTSLIFKGSAGKFDISNSLFENYYYTIKQPPIIEARYAKINITDSEFKNFK